MGISPHSEEQETQATQNALAIGCAYWPADIKTIAGVWDLH